jgi:hypothetical protein
MTRHTCPICKGAQVVRSVICWHCLGVGSIPNRPSRVTDNTNTITERKAA